MKTSMKIVIGLLLATLVVFPFVSYFIWPALMSLVTVGLHMIFSFFSILLSFWPIFALCGVILVIAWGVKRYV